MIGVSMKVMLPSPFFLREDLSTTAVRRGSACSRAKDRDRDRGGDSLSSQSTEVKDSRVSCCCRSTSTRPPTVRREFRLRCPTFGGSRKRSWKLGQARVVGARTYKCSNEDAILEVAARWWELVLVVEFSAVDIGPIGGQSTAAVVQRTQVCCYCCWWW